jgi:hypothetical protein
MFPPELERDAFRTANGEFGWTRAQIPLVVEVLRSHGMGILGGELWWIRDESTSCDGLIPQRHGPPAVYTWAADRLPSESWPDFVERGASDALAHVERWPNAQDLRPVWKGEFCAALHGFPESNTTGSRAEASNARAVTTHVVFIVMKSSEIPMFQE